MKNLPGFDVIGLSVRTSNQNGRAAKDIAALWDRFFVEDVTSRISGKTSKAIFSIYTDYASDFKGPYTVILGFAVDNLVNIPDGFTGKSIGAANYELFSAKGAISDGVVYRAWETIWNSGIRRAYTADFERYSEKPGEPGQVKVDIFVSIHA